MSEEFEIAERFYFSMLERELRTKNQPEAVPEMRKVLRLRSLSETVEGVDTGGGPPPEGEPRIELRVALSHRLSNYECRLDGESGELISYYVDFLAVGGDRSMSAEDAIAVATKFAKPPDDTSISHSGYDQVGDRTVFCVRWSHTHQGLPVEDDFIEVLVNGKARLPFSVTWRYHEPKIAPGPRP
jgi:hypothetical protein